MKAIRKRPLFAACVLLFALRAFLFWRAGGIYPKEAILPRQGQDVTVCGQVVWREEKQFYVEPIIYNQIQNENLNQSFSNQTNQIYESNLDSKDIPNIGQRKLNKALKNEGKGRKGTWKILCEYSKAKSACVVAVGDYVCVTGNFQGYGIATNPGEFDQQKYYYSKGICGKMNGFSVERIEGEGTTTWSSFGKARIIRGFLPLVKEELCQIRQELSRRLEHVYPQKEAGILETMLLAEKEDLDIEVKRLYQNGGIIHILSISGLHISLIGMGLYQFLRKMGVPELVASFLGAVVLILYGIMTGMSVSCARAVGMFLLRMLSVWCRRTYDMLTAVGVLVVIMVYMHPGYLWQSGFWLSYLSVFAVGGCLPLFKGLIKRHWLWKVLLPSICIQLVTLPVQLHFYYEMPMWSMLLNLAVLPMMSILVISAGLSLVPGLGILGTGAYGLLRVIEELCKKVEMLPTHTWNPGYVSGKKMIVYYSVFIGSLWLWKRKKRVVKIVAEIGFASLLFIVAYKAPTNGNITFLDVGQGDCIFVESMEGEHYLFDCGSSSYKHVGSKVLIPFLKYRGAKRLDGIFISHSDEDHISGLMELFEKAREESISISYVIVPATMEEEEIEEIGKACGKEKIRKVSAGDFLKGKAVYFRCLHPKEGKGDFSSNENSACFYVELKTKGGEKGLSILMTGDVEDRGELQLIAELAKQKINHVDLLKQPHHGSKNSGSIQLLKMIYPKASVISCGKNNTYGHPHAETLERLESYGCKILRTDESGCITIANMK